MGADLMPDKLWEKGLMKQNKDGLYRINVFIRQDQEDRLTKIQILMGIPKSEVIQQALDEFLKKGNLVNGKLLAILFPLFYYFNISQCVITTIRLV